MIGLGPAKDVKPPPEPVQVDAARIVGAGTVLWFVAFLAMVPFYGTLREDDHLVWLWTALAGTALGLLGLVMIRRHRGQGRTK